MEANRAEFRWIVLSMILLAIVSVAAPIFNEQVFSVVIPNADRALMVQIFLMSAVFVAGTVALQYMNAVIGARIRRNCEWHLQTALMDRLLDLPSAFFREHSRGELKNRFDSLLLLVQVFSNGAISALLNVVTLVPATKIVIAHRLSTVRTADRIYVLDHGRVAEEGTFDELMAKGGLFATLAKRQM